MNDAIVDRMTASMEPLLMCTVEGMLFSNPDIADGPWRNFCTGMVGDVAHDEADVLWPNQVPSVLAMPWSAQNTVCSHAGHWQHTN